MTRLERELTPSYDLTFAPDGTLYVQGSASSVVPCHQFKVGDYVLSHVFESELPVALSDLISVASAVYLADRVCPRRLPGQDRYDLAWTRRIRVTLPVRDILRWQDAAMQEILREVLQFYTEDEWDFEFLPLNNVPQSRAIQASLFPVANRVQHAALFSGGLDSLAGLCQELIDLPSDGFLLFAANTSPRTQGVQAKLSTLLRERTKRVVEPCFVPIGLRKRGPRAQNRDETSQRSRGFVFAAFGAVTALMGGLNQLSIYENGVGAVNLPYTRAQIGVHLTRATHPLALQKMSAFVSRATGAEFKFLLPFLFTTKGQLCRSIAELQLGPLVDLSVSCDGFPQRIEGQPQCGLCTSCLLRRQAIYAAGLMSFDNPAHYREDIFSSLNHLPAAKLYPFRAMLYQVARLREAIASPDPWASLCTMYPQLMEISLELRDNMPASGSVEDQLIAMYKRYCDEWEQLPARPPRGEPLRPSHVGANYGE
ncbi:MAG TPA: hypothetical protein VF615_29320 [Longimicrobiaceae bacterium]|jgi:hypothetical protein